MMSDQEKLQLARLMEFAVNYCIDIFELFNSIEIEDQLTPIRAAWLTGRELSALKAQIDN